MSTSRKLPPLWRAVRFVAETLMFRLLRWRPQVRGLEHVPRRGAAVVAFNHHSYFDFVMVGWPLVARLGRPLTFLAKREIWSSPWLGWLVRAADAVPVDRERPDARHGAFAAAVEALRQGHMVVVAPEQTISRSFELLPYRTGVVRMAQAAGAPIVPAVGFGTQRFAGKGTGIHLAFRLPVSIAYGEPMHVGEDEDPVEATARLQRRSAALLDEVLASYPDAEAGAGAWWWPERLGGAAPSHDEVLAAHEERIRHWRERQGE